MNGIDAAFVILFFIAMTVIMGVVIYYEGQSPTPVYKLPNGDIVACEGFSENDCGVDLNRCSSNRDYYCLKNVEELKPKKEVE